MSFYTFIQRCNQTALYWFSTYWFKASYSFRPLIHSALIGSDVAKLPLNISKSYNLCSLSLTPLNVLVKYDHVPYTYSYYFISLGTIV
ncbi:hypothetical protein Hanom_Chr07g00641161 [Helianthus anomalus]